MQGSAFAVVRGLVRGDEFKAVLPLLGGHRASADFLARRGIAPHDLHRRPIFKAVAGDGFKPFAGAVFRLRGFPFPFRHAASPA